MLARPSPGQAARWWALTGSNRRPSRCKRDALPTELSARSREGGYLGFIASRSRSAPPQAIRALAAEGKAVVVISSYLPEIMAISDRILVARGGRIVEEMTATQASEEKIMYAAIH